MLYNYAQAFTILAADIEKCRAQILIEAHQLGVASLEPTAALMVNFKGRVSVLLATCMQVDQLDRLKGPIGRLLARLDSPLPTSELYHTVDSIQLQLMDELDRLKLYHVEERLVPLYEDPAPFGLDVFNNFASANSDIVNAGKCLALGQATACVFHLMRVMEVGLRALSKDLGISYAPSWEAHLKQIKARMDVRHASKARGWKKQEPFFKEVVGDLEAIKLAWRNPTMHIVREFDVDQAENVYRAVRALMIHLASRLKEPPGQAPTPFGMVVPTVPS